MSIYSFPVIGNPSSASTRSVMMALGLVMLSLLSGFGIMYLIGLLGVDTAHLLWIPVLSTAPAVIFAMFAVVHDEAKREAHFRDMSLLVTDAIILATGIELGERDIRRMVDGERIDVEGGALRIETQRNGRNKNMILIKDEDGTTGNLLNFPEESGIKEDGLRDIRAAKTIDHDTRTVAIPTQSSKSNLDPSTDELSGTATKTLQKSGAGSTSISSN